MKENKDNIIPNFIKNKRKQGKINFEFKKGRLSEINATEDMLVDGDTSSPNSYGILLYEQERTGFKFTIYDDCDIWAYGEKYSDSGGSTPKDVDLYQYDEKINDFKLVKEGIKTYEDKWYLLFENLKKGTYQVKTKHRYAKFTEWYVNRKSDCKILVQDRDKNIYYKKDDDSYITKEDGVSINEKLFKEKGMDYIPEEFYQTQQTICASNKPLKDGILKYEMDLSDVFEIQSIELDF